jgi:SAM-dependent methyltransferase
MKFDRVLRKIIPSVARLTYNPIFKFLVDGVDVLPRHVYDEFSNIPPNHMRIRVGVANRIFTNHVFHLNEAKDFWFYALHSGLCRLDSRLVDIGCGCGRFAQHLRDYRFKQDVFSGRYIGIDIDDEMLDWCRRNFDSERFEFHRSNHVSKAYNVAGKADVDYVLPIGNETVDFVFSTSLFTHLLERELVNYCRESYRVLKPRCCMAMYCFSMDHPPPTLGDRHTFRFKIGNAHVESISVPEAAVAYEEEFLFKVAREAGFQTAQMLVGPDDWQPMLLCRK